MLLGAGVVAVSAIYAAGTLVSIVLALALLYRRIARPGFELDLHSWWPLMRVAAPLGIAGVFITVLLRVDTAMLAFYKSDEVVGNYGAAYRLFEATLVVGWSVTAAVYPVFSRLRRDSEPPLGLVFERSLKLVLAPTLPLAIGAVVLGGSIVQLVYGHDFGEAAGALAWLAPAIVLYPLAQVSAALLIARDRQGTVAVVYGVVALENVLANLLLIPAFSLDGAAAGASLSQLLIAIPFFVLAWRTAGPIQVWRIVAAPLVASALSAVAMVALRGFFGLALAAGALVFVGALVFFERRFYPGDVAAMIAIVRRRPAV
jgi:O-antigen/teichoic acid export membrane protein